MFDAFLEPLRIYLLPTLTVVFSFWYIWLPAMFIMGFWHIWVNFKRREFHFNQGFVLLEMRLPKDISKSPAAMEAVLNHFYQTAGEATFIDRYINGKTRAWFSLELVSIEGQVRFFIWSRKNLRNLIEAQLYAQYPSIEIHEVPDYALPVVSDPSTNTMWGCEFDLTKPDAYPIKTYIDYGLDRDPDEEFKIDPLASLTEYLGSIGRGEQIWIQIIIRAHKKERKKAGTWFGTVDWTDDAKKEIEKLRKQSIIDSEGEKSRVSVLTEGTKDTIAAIERSIGKTPFDCGIRGIYIADKDVFNPINITGLTGAFKSFSSQDHNGFKPARGLTGFDYPWQDYADIRKNKKKADLLDAYKRRSYFHLPAASPSFVLTNEEVATLYHFPGQSVATPTFTRIPSRKAEAPSNLPI
ncbi:MAG: hypothetical protein COV34_02020 [Candidatus Zambryskibacteria bacterium CG10_big_fil_rev_8_21_14_0_10_42_12]|uniref:DUF8128 domain-containing protein n=1 Tax=Candidatus Zambryskibacteria bacterium CG10_big_fil_rev_8_21_14_0_10_42_12 TaxID=1975115 RepID=A0A2H0QVQ7_9BACT|nr:MAG: hypothetical protein COV34_02020 [Candidatus Zambryskibacteria bacterium CG10_big_fil_rev_8_21_14_0_10_42_12]